MGEYTGLRGWVDFNDDTLERYQKMVDNFNNHMTWGEAFLNKHDMSKKVFDFVTDCRAHFIPFGASTYFEEWERNNDTPKLRAEGNRLYFACSLKNYTRTIEKFIDALPDLATAWDLESRFEYDSESKFYRKGVVDEQQAGIESA
jgi:hypothetical protein